MGEIVYRYNKPEQDISPTIRLFLKMQSNYPNLSDLAIIKLMDLERKRAKDALKHQHITGHYQWQKGMCK